MEQSTPGVSNEGSLSLSNELLNKEDVRGGEKEKSMVSPVGKNAMEGAKSMGMNGVTLLKSGLFDIPHQVGQNGSTAPISQSNPARGHGHRFHRATTSQPYTFYSNPSTQGFHTTGSATNINVNTYPPQPNQNQYGYFSQPIVGKHLTPHDVENQKLLQQYYSTEYFPKSALKLSSPEPNYMRLDLPNMEKLEYTFLKDVLDFNGVCYFKEFVCVHQNDRNCEARVIEKQENGYCCLHGVHKCCDTKSFSISSFPPRIPMNVEEAPLDFKINPKNIFHCDEKLFNVVGIIPNSSTPKSTVQIFVTYKLDHKLDPNNLVIFFGSEKVENSKTLMTIPAVIPSKCSEWKNEFDSDFCIFCNVPEITGLGDTSLLDVKIQIKDDKLESRLDKGFVYRHEKERKKQKK